MHIRRRCVVTWAELGRTTLFKQTYATGRGAQGVSDIQNARFSFRYGNVSPCYPLKMLVRDENRMTQEHITWWKHIYDNWIARYLVETHLNTFMIIDLIIVSPKHDGITVQIPSRSGIYTHMEILVIWKRYDQQYELDMKFQTRLWVPSPMWIWYFDALQWQSQLSPGLTTSGGLP